MTTLLCCWNRKLLPTPAQGALGNEDRTGKRGCTRRDLKCGKRSLTDLKGDRRPPGRLAVGPDRALRTCYNESESEKRNVVTAVASLPPQATFVGTLPCVVTTAGDSRQQSQGRRVKA